MSTSAPAPPVEVPSSEDGAGNGADPRRSMIESIFDNLSFWTAMAAAVGFLYLVWATLEILSRYTGHIPSVTP